MQGRTAASFLVGNRVSLQPLTPDDVPLLVQWANDPATRQMARNAFPRSIEGTKKQLEEINTGMPKNDMIWMGIWHNADTKVIGEAKFTRLDLVNRNASLWVAIGDASYWHKKVGREVIDLMLKYAFEELGLHKVMANIIVDNKGAVAAFTECGLTLELTFKDHVHFDFTYHDVGVFAILASEWQARMRGQGR